MTDAESYAIGERALRAGFKWRPGCLAVSTREKYNGSIYVCQDYDGAPMFVGQYPGADTVAHNGMAPDVRDCGVIAHMLDQVRERAGASFYLSRDLAKNGWDLQSSTPSYLVSGIVGTWGTSQGECLALALEVTQRGGF